MILKIALQEGGYKFFESKEWAIKVVKKGEKVLLTPCLRILTSRIDKEAVRAYWQEAESKCYTKQNYHMGEATANADLHYAESIEGDCIYFGIGYLMDGRQTVEKLT